MSTLTKPVGAPASQNHPSDVDLSPGVPAQEVEQILIHQLVPSQANPRKTIDVVFLAQLADSIRQLGIQVPLLVRYNPMGEGDDPLYEIVAGHRRFAAAQQLGSYSVPCIVREMSDDEAREIMLVENLQREDLAPLEEAEAYEALRTTLGTAEAIAAKVGKPVEYVTRRLKLLTLIPFSREALAERLITIDHALLLSKLAAAEQETALRFALDRTALRKETTREIVAKSVKRRTEKRTYGYWEPQSVLELKRFIEDEIKLELKRAPWDLADAELLPAAGACAGCPKNTAANTALFGDLAVTDARCTDAECFAAKRDAFVQIQLAAVKAAGADAVRVSWKETNAKPRSLFDSGDEKYLGQIFKAGQWIEAKKGSCGFVRTGITVDFDAPAWGTPDAKKKPGMKLLVCVAPDCKVHEKAWKQTERARPNSADNARAEREKRERQAELNKAENAIRKAAVKAALDGVKQLDGELLRRVVQQALPEWHDTDIEAIFPGLEPALEKENVDSPRFARAAAAVLLCDEVGQYFAHPGGYGDAERGRDELIKLLAAMGYDARKHWQKAPSSKTAKAPAKKPKSSPARDKKTPKKSAKRQSQRAFRAAALAKYGAAQTQAVKKGGKR